MSRGKVSHFFFVSFKWDHSRFTIFDVCTRGGRDLILYHSFFSPQICRIARPGAGTGAQGATTGSRGRCQRATPRSFQLLQKLRTVQQCHLVPAIRANLFIALDISSKSNSKRSSNSTRSSSTPLAAAAAGHDVVVVVEGVGVMANSDDAGKPVCAIIPLRATPDERTNGTEWLVDISTRQLVKRQQHFRGSSFN